MALVNGYAHMNGVSPAAENDEAQIETGEIPVKQMMKKFGGTGKFGSVQRQ